MSGLPSSERVIDLSISGMTCDSCRNHVLTGLQTVPGVSAVEVNLERGEAIVELSDSSVSLETLVAAVEKAGYSAALRQIPPLEE